MAFVNKTEVGEGASQFGPDHIDVALDFRPQLVHEGFDVVCEYHRIVAD